MIGLCLAFLGGSSSFGSRLATILDVGDKGYVSRLEVWRRALGLVGSTLLGVRFRSFSRRNNPLFETPKPGIFSRAENEYIDMLVEGGAIGFILVLAFSPGLAGLPVARFAISRAGRSGDLWEVPSSG